MKRFLFAASLLTLFIISAGCPKPGNQLGDRSNQINPQTEPVQLELAGTLTWLPSNQKKAFQAFAANDEDAVFDEGEPIACKQSASEIFKISGSEVSSNYHSIFQYLVKNSESTFNGFSLNLGSSQIKSVILNGNNLNTDNQASKNVLRLSLDRLVRNKQNTLNITAQIEDSQVLVKSTFWFNPEACEGQVSFSAARK